jgi:monofunctional biosynthetic peptidoglycan transglycosylase
MPRLLRLALAAGAVFLLVGGSAAWGRGAHRPRRDRKRTPFPTALMRARAAQARQKGERGDIDCRFVPYDRISPLLRRAVLVAEDDAFFQHGGLDWNEIGASARRNLERGHIVRGGSTITQQLARNLFLGEERTITRKFKEVVLAVRLEHAISKRRILELYLNLIEWGDGIYGAGAAARRYFGVSAEDLNARQALLLACVIINPRRFSPLDPPPRIEKRVRTIAGRMLRRGQLSAAEYRLAVGEPAPVEAAAAPDSTRAPEPGEAAGGAAGTDTAATAAGDTTGQAPPE